MIYLRVIKNSYYFSQRPIKIVGRYLHRTSFSGIPDSTFVMNETIKDVLSFAPPPISLFAEFYGPVILESKPKAEFIITRLAPKP
jgi:hypothetical protein